MSDFSRREMVALSAALPLIARSGTADAAEMPIAAASALSQGAGEIRFRPART